jgi:iron-regulated transporter 1
VPRPLHLYFHQQAAPAALALALLYLSVMSFGTLMTAYLKWRGVGEVELSIYRG